MFLRDELARVEAELTKAVEDHARASALVEGLRAQRQALLQAMATMQAETRPGAAPKDLTAATKADAIVQVLRDAAGPLRIKEIVSHLKRAGRPGETYDGVAVYLTTLHNDGRVTRVGRGLYTAAE